MSSLNNRINQAMPGATIAGTPLSSTRRTGRLDCRAPSIRAMIPMALCPGRRSSLIWRNMWSASTCQCAIAQGSPRWSRILGVTAIALRPIAALRLRRAMWSSLQDYTNNRKSLLSAPIYHRRSSNCIRTPITIRRSCCPGLCWSWAARNRAVRSQRNSIRAGERSI